MKTTQVAETPGLTHGPTTHAPALNNGGGDVANLVCLCNQLAIVLEKALVEKVVALDAGKSQRKLVALKLGQCVLVDIELGSGTLPLAPGLDMGRKGESVSSFPKIEEMG